ncbi:trypsin-like peptidase domain-containing protein [bacterium]|nr:trypsin-like peptidase domain-containing protein [bacterium]MDB4468375.1 trypsin-like peptidase domain-containing protein [bacterium]MDB4483718.1 trypsin-like peptidase domain-containing protein [bacterium]
MRVKFSLELPLFLLLASCVFLLPTSVIGQSSQSSSRACLYFVTQQSCPPCRQMDPVIESLAGQGYPVKTVHLENNRAWAQWANVRSTPTVVMLDGNDQIVKRFSGVIGRDVLQSWFANAGVRPAIAKQKRMPEGLGKHFTDPLSANWNSDSGNSADIANQGTSRPRNSYEELALASTVKIGLNVASQAYVDFASGTSIYNSGDMSLILTCGHLFRESNGAGQISVMMSSSDGGVREFGGTLLDWDATNRDIALVKVFHPGIALPVNPIAPRTTSVFASDNLFTVGCDLSNRSTLGETYNGIRETGPTIRQTQIKKISNYGGINKFDILGSPAQGRSGGGLFTKTGSLIGVCNARICDADEGIYTGLDSVYWVIDRAGLTDLFEEKKVVGDNYLVGAVPGKKSVPSGGFQEVPLNTVQGLFAPNQTKLSPVVSRRGGSKVIIVIENEVGESELITIENPSSELLSSVRAFRENRQQALKQLEITSARSQ